MGAGGERRSPRSRHGTTVATNQLLEGKVERPRLHHHRGLRVHPRDRPAVGARRLRQLLLLGQAAADRAGRPGQDRRRPARLRGQRDPAVRRGAAPSRRPGGSATGASTTIGVCFLHSYADDSHELRDARRPAPRAPRRGRVDLAARCCASTASTSASITTLVDAAVKPNVSPLRRNIRRRGSTSFASGASVPFYVMKSNGGVLSADEVVHQPITTVLSGPAAGALGAALDRRSAAGFDQGAHLRRRRHLDRRRGRARRRADADHRGHASAPTRARSR